MIYLDNHATTPCDPRVVQRMLPFFTEAFGNPHSTSHAMGREAADAIERSIASVGRAIGVSDDRVLITSGATESNNLAIEGICRHPRQKKRHLITTTIEHPAVLDVVARLEKGGFRVTRVPVHPQGHPEAGRVDLQRLAESIDEDTVLVSIHWANNEIGVIQPMQQIADLVHRSGALLHSDATQAIGRLPVDLRQTDVDLVSGSAHKFYGPKGVGFLTYHGGTESRRVRIAPQIVGGGQQRNLRSGTLSPAHVVGLADALQWAVAERVATAERSASLRQILWSGLQSAIKPLELNGPPLMPDLRLSGNLNVLLPDVEGEAWMSASPEVAFSSGSACSSVDAKPSHVITALTRSESEARRSVRFGIGKFNTEAEIEQALERLAHGYQSVRPG